MRVVTKLSVGHRWPGTQAFSSLPARARNKYERPEGMTLGAFVTFVNGGADGSRTRDLCIANAALYQLSYCPTGPPRFSARAKGRERPAEGGGGQYE